MKLLTSTFASAILLALPSAADDAIIYLTGSSPTDSPPSTINPSDARLVIAQRLGLTRHQSLKETTDDSLRAINNYGSSAQSIFSAQSPSRRGLVIIEGVVEPEGLFADLGVPHFTLETPPSSSVNEEFLSNLRQQYVAEHGSASLSSVERPEEGTEAGITLSSWMFKADSKFDQKDLIFHDTVLETIANKYGMKSAEYREMLQQMHDQLQRLLSSKGQHDELMLILAPYLSSSSTKAKRSPSIWGALTDVKQEEPVLGAGHADFIPESADFDAMDTVGGAGAAVDTPTVDQDPALVRPAVDDVAKPAAPPAVVPAVATSALGSQPSQNATKPPRGILPYCFATADGCASATNNCSGHGKCIRKYTDTTGSTEQSCFTCSCSSSRLERGNGYKTVQWAGPACQKKDVSVEFWLLGGTTIALVSAIAWGMSLLYSMGSEDLPSVIGAGVANPGARAK